MYRKQTFGHATRMSPIPDNGRREGPAAAAADRRVTTIALRVLFLAVLVHRAVQLYLLWPPLAHQIDLNPQAQVMQLLPRDLWREHFFAAIAWLQQSPPLPNLVFGMIVNLLESPRAIALALIALNGVGSALTAALMALLLIRLGIGTFAGCALAGIFAASPDLLLMEYHTWGHFHYEISSMLLCVLASHAALGVRRSRGSGAALWLGFWVALLALTRATYSYLFVVVFAWLLAAQGTRRPVVLASFLLPVMLLQGGWALKILVHHDYWSFATSSWGGANAYTGDALRNGTQRQFRQWVEQSPDACEQPWQGMLTQLPPYLFFMRIFDPSEHLPVTQAVLDHDRAIDVRRGQRVILDTLAFRELSLCLQRAYMRYWMENPRLAIASSLQSYKLFWLPIRQFNVLQPNPILPDMPVFEPLPHPGQLLRAALAERARGGYRMLQRSIGFTATRPQELVPVSVLVLPVLPLLLHAVNMLALHLLPVLAPGFHWRNGGLRAGSWPPGFGFLPLLYVYLALVCNLVEYGENMRFRLEVEPLVWAISAVCVRLFWMNSGRRSAPRTGGRADA